MKSVLCLLIVALSFGSCMKSNTGCNMQQSNAVAPVAEQERVQQYIDSVGAVATKHSSGFFYNIIDAGAGASPELCSIVRMSYTGTRTDGVQFETNPSLEIRLGQLIEGWKKGLPLIKKGGRIMLYIPPTLAYGSNEFRDQQGNIIIPANAILIFDITLTDVS